MLHRFFQKLSQSSSLINHGCARMPDWPSAFTVWKFPSPTVETPRFGFLWYPFLSQKKLGARKFFIYVWNAIRFFERYWKRHTTTKNLLWWYFTGLRNFPGIHIGGTWERHTSTSLEFHTKISFDSILAAPYHLWSLSFEKANDHNWIRL